ncbi:hypothetical protein KJ596_01930 [Patescibacteria group bacterium]|nr:hypothetical protein [Patescibacteria group bacterium]MBU1868006.1 hypothetical protein [Patescibacteria group bacterium]
MPLIIIVLITILSAVAFVELVLSKLRSNRRKAIKHIEILDNQLEIVEALSYIPSSKIGSLTDKINELAQIFFRQQRCVAISLISTGNIFQEHARVLRCFPDKRSERDQQLDSLEEYLLSQVNEEESKGKTEKLFIVDSLEGTTLKESSRSKHRIAIIKPLDYQTKRMGCVIFFSESETPMSPEERDFLSSVGNIISYILRKLEVEVLLTPSEQLTAIDVEW